MRKALLLLGLLLLASIYEMVVAKNHAYLPDLETPSEHSALVLSWRSGSEQFATLHEQLSKDFDKWGATRKMVKNIFYRSHQKLFRQYKQYSLAQDTFVSGSYDCVSGSLILAGLLDYFGFDYEIKETTYHVFLRVKVDNGFIVLEVTDPINGFILDKEAQKAYLEKYQRAENAPNQWSVLTSNQADSAATIYRSINFQNLIGLQYFNQAINHYNSNNELLAYQFSVTALKMHDAERIQKFSDFLKENLAKTTSN